MLTALWILNGVLAVFFLVAGGMKLLRTKEELRASGQGWTDDFRPGSIKGIGVAEVLGALGLILPLATGIAPVLAPLAAAGLAIDMGAATVVHSQRNETMLPTLGLGLATTVSVVLGFIHVL
ncbi:DoxX family protein [Demequina sp. SYSU T00192]|uniref:DoxX family protein n=1 Tax=Demequina litoralis TaxID=3051660 RepID=A0ABT8GBB2_9MICO|nr:DoxX family protein [Demequina sp. SYSU T00192]MDN4476421.1 DoxX family protein [Demequina sp. SYSU T00192]